MKKIFKFQGGVSLIELLLYMGILSILLVVLTRTFTQALDVSLESEAGSALEQDGNYILARLAYDIHRANSIATPSVNGSSGSSVGLVINGTNYTYNIDAGSNLSLTVGGISYPLNNSDSSVSSFSVQRLGNPGKIEDTLKINYTISSRVKRFAGSEPPVSFQTTLSLRRQ